jgi:hypothetical protein
MAEVITEPLTEETLLNALNRLDSQRGPLSVLRVWNRCVLRVAPGDPELVAYRILGSQEGVYVDARLAPGEWKLLCRHLGVD